MPEEMLKRVLDARVSEVLPEPTPLDEAPHLSARVGQPVFLKREDLTPVFSFKLRGAYNRIAGLDEVERAAGVLAASAGNHAQGVAYSARALGLDCRIVMPVTTPAIKVDAVRALGAGVTLVGDTYAEAAAEAERLAVDSGAVLIPPFDDLDVIAGQGTIALELLRQAPRDLGSIFVPVGGGGLIAGIASVLKEIRPEVRVIGVEPRDADAMARSLESGEREVLEQVGIFADGVAVKQVGAHTLEICRRLVDEIVTVDVDAMCAAIKAVFEDTRSVAEPAGALSIAGLKHVADDGRLPPGPAVAVVSGANMNFARLGFVAERTQVGEQREAIFAVTLPERPGSFKRFCNVLEARAITEFNYRLASRAEAHVFVGLAVEDRAEARAIAGDLEDDGFPCEDLTDDDLAKTHVRHMVGGRTDEVTDEVLYRFVFPERPGALSQFLTALGDRWNISLFHYRNHGDAYGRVLCGLEVPAAERADLRERLDRLGFRYVEETSNPAARLFL